VMIIVFQNYSQTQKVRTPIENREKSLCDALLGIWWRSKVMAIRKYIHR
jgi:hypothetical protein